MLELRADATAKAEAAIVESRMEHGLGPISTLIIRWGTLKAEDYFVAGTAWGKVKLIRDSMGKPVKVAPPSTAVDVAGFKKLPEPGYKTNSVLFLLN